MREKRTKYFSMSRAIFWVCIMVLAYFFGWIYSVAFVSICSIYANAASDFASYRADDNKELIEKLDKILEKLNDNNL